MYITYEEIQILVSHREATKRKSSARKSEYHIIRPSQKLQSVRSQFNFVLYFFSEYSESLVHFYKFDFGQNWRIKFNNFVDFQLFRNDVLNLY